MQTSLLFVVSLGYSLILYLIYGIIFEGTLNKGAENINFIKKTDLTIDYENKKNKYVTIAEFELEEDRYVIDFCKLPNIPSIFGKIKNYYLIYFIHDLVLDFTKDIAKDGKEHIEYVPTQIVTEFFRFSFNKNRKKKIDGIIYPSSKNMKNRTSVFFWDNAESEKLLSLKSLKRERIRS